MDKKETYTASDAQLKELKAKLHRIPEQHLVDRTSSPVVATKSRYLHVRSLVHDRRSCNCLSRVLLAECFNK